MSGLADKYERLYPDTGISDAQKEQRMEKIVFDSERKTHHRTGRTRGVVLSGRAGATLERIFGGSDGTT